MATSFRLPEEHMRRLKSLAKRLGVSKAQVVKQAIDKYYEEQIEKSTRSALDRLIESGFEPVNEELPFSAADEVAQREIIREKLSKKRRH